MSIRTWLAALSLSAAVTGAAHAIVISYDQAIPMTPTSFSTQVDFPQFDPSVGTLQSVKITVYAQTDAVVGFESFDPLPSEVSGTVQTNVTVFRPDNSAIITVSPAAPFAASLTGFDGTYDRDGTSGKTIDDLSANQVLDITLTDVSDLTLFTGNGTISLPVTAVGLSSILGPATLAFLSDAVASATVQIDYEYMLIPEPATCLLLGLSSLALLRRRRVA